MIDELALDVWSLCQYENFHFGKGVSKPTYNKCKYCGRNHSIKGFFEPLLPTPVLCNENDPA